MRLGLATILGSPAKTLLGFIGLIVIFGIPFYATLWYTQYGPDNLKHYIKSQTPYLQPFVPAPEVFPSLLASTSPISLPPAPLSPPTCPPLSPSNETLLLSLGIFSNARFHPRPAKFRRDLIRRTILLGLPHSHRHLVSIKFIMGRSWDPAQETLHDREERMYGDMIRLSIPDGDGERGKAVEWLRTVGEGRPSHWVVKCNDDVLPIIPNLIPYLLNLDSSKPTIIASTFNTDPNHISTPKVLKYLYGFSWGIARSIVLSNMNDDEKNRDLPEGEYIGALMHSLPSLPGKSNITPPNKISVYPKSADKRTGLIWSDLGNNVSPWDIGNRTSTKGEAIAWCGIGNDQMYEHDVIPSIIKDMHGVGKRYTWNVPESMKHLSKCPTIP